VKTLLRPFILALTAMLGTLVLTGPAQATTTPYCGIYWGSLAKSGSQQDPVPGATLVNARAGQHDCYDRLVVDIAGTTHFDAWQVQYVSGVTDEAGNPITVRGGAMLQVIVRAAGYNDQGAATYNPANPHEAVNVTGFRTFRQVSYGGSFEAVSTFYLGVRARLPFRVFTLAGIPGSANGTRLVVDVAHAW